MTQREFYIKSIAKMSPHPRTTTLCSIKKTNPKLGQFTIRVRASMPLFKQEDALMSVGVRYYNYSKSSVDSNDSNTFTSIKRATVHEEWYTDFRMEFTASLTFVLHGSQCPIILLTTHFKGGAKKKYADIYAKVEDLTIEQVVI